MSSRYKICLDFFDVHYDDVIEKFHNLENILNQKFLKYVNYENIFIKYCGYCTGYDMVIKIEVFNNKSYHENVKYLLDVFLKCLNNENIIYNVSTWVDDKGDTCDEF